MRKGTLWHIRANMRFLNIEGASGKFVREKDQLVFQQERSKSKKMHTVSLLDKKKQRRFLKKKKKKNCGGLFSIVSDFWVLVATVGVWKKWSLRFGKVWKKYGIFFSVVAADPDIRAALDFKSTPLKTVLKNPDLPQSYDCFRNTKST